jgi:hypothetical protein
VNWSIRAVARPRLEGVVGDLLVVAAVNVPYRITATRRYPLREACALFHTACGFVSPSLMEAGLLARYPSLHRPDPHVWIHHLERPANVRWWEEANPTHEEVAHGACV